MWISRADWDLDGGVEWAGYTDRVYWGPRELEIEKPIVVRRASLMCARIVLVTWQAGSCRISSSISLHY